MNRDNAGMSKRASGPVLLVVLALSLLSGCARAEPATRIQAFSYRVDGGRTGTVQDLDKIPVNSSNRSLEVWFDLPPAPSCMDPVLLVEQTSTLNELTIGSRKVDVLTRPFGLVPLRADEGGSRAELVFRERLGRREGPVWVGCRSELELYWYAMGLLPFVVGAALLASAGLLALAFAFGRRAVIGWLALLVLAFGVTALTQSPAFRSMLLAPTWPAAWVRAVFAFVQM